MTAQANYGTGRRKTATARVFLSAGTDPQSVLAACFEHGVKLTRFDTSAPPLHEIFVYLAGGNSEGLEP